MVACNLVSFNIVKCAHYLCCGMHCKIVSVCSIEQSKQHFNVIQFIDAIIAYHCLCACFVVTIRCISCIIS